MAISQGTQGAIGWEPDTRPPARCNSSVAVRCTSTANRPLSGQVSLPTSAEPRPGVRNRRGERRGTGSAPADPSFVDVSAGARHACGLRTNGSLTCWGDNTYGQASDPSGNTFIHVSASGDLFVCALKNDGTLICWGDDFGGVRNVPTGSDFVQVSAGYYHYACALRRNGSITYWGDNANGQASPRQSATLVRPRYSRKNPSLPLRMNPAR